MVKHYKIRKFALPLVGLFFNITTLNNYPQ
nr:MAG TPA: hypothetical protein [Caudoviricetes sp.]